MKHDRRSRRGASALESALITPVLLALIGGCLDYGWTFLKIHQLQDTVREAARLTARVDYADDPTASFDAELESAALHYGLDPAQLTGNATVSGEAGFRSLEVTVDASWTSLTGLVTSPKGITVTYTCWLEDQDLST